MNIIEKAFYELYPDKTFNYNAKIKYSGKFSDYNANVRYTRENMEFHLSRKWKTVSEEIRRGLLQSLMVKVYGEKARTTNMDLYNLFLKNVHIAVPKNECEKILEESFNRINEKYFNGLIDKPNIVFGQKAMRKLGSYQYGTDNVTISSVLKDAPQEILDYILYHELLHKKHKFRNSGIKSYHHTKEFKKDEQKFDNYEIVEKNLKAFLTKKSLKRSFLGFLFE